MTVWSLLLDAVRSALFGLSHVFGGSLGMGIISLSILVRLALLPWTVSAVRRSLAMRDSLKALEPRLRDLRRRNASNPAKLREAILSEYQRAGVRPLRDSGLPVMALQIPLGWAIYTVIRTGIEGGTAFLWIADLARPDVAMSLLTGALSVVMGMTTSSSGGPVSPVAMALIMGVASFAVVLHLSSGLALYWASTTSIGILQNAIVRRSAATA